MVAVTSTVLLLAACDRLVPEISYNDKTPITDGHIDLYEGVSRKKTEIVGRMPVQVKGRSIGSKRRTSTKFQIPRTDVVALRRHGSVLYFVVFVDSRSRTVPFYVVMSPFYIDSVLRKAPPTAEQVTVELRALPEQPEKLERIVAMALETKKQQYAAFSGHSFENVTSMTLHSVEAIDLDAPLRVSADEWSYAIDVETADGNALPLVGEVTIYPQSYLPQETALTVESGGVQYHAPTIRQVDPTTHELTLAEGLQIRLRTGEDSRSSSINLTLAPDLAGRLKAVEFCLNLVERQSITYDGVAYAFEYATSDNIDELRGYREYLRLLRELFDLLHVDSSLVHMDEIDDQQHDRLRLLHGALVHGRELRADDGRVGRTDEAVGTNRLMLLVTQGSQPNTWRLLDPFDPRNQDKFKLFREVDSGRVQEWHATVYDGVQTSDLPDILNLRLDRLTDAYDAIADLPDVTSLANTQLLSLILAADRCEPRRSEFLGAAKALNEWIIAREGELPPHLINRWQLRHRTNDLDRDDLDQIRDLRRRILREQLEMGPQLETACAILLGDLDDIEHSVRQLSNDERQQMERWPIWAVRGERSPEDAVALAPT